MARSGRTFVRVTIAAFWMLAVAFAIFVCFRDPIKNDIYGFAVHNEEVFRCPSCGLTRAVYSLMRFDFVSAFYYHAYFAVTFPFWGYAAVTLSVNLFAGKKIMPYPKRYAVYLWIAFALWMLFTVLRNFTSVIY